MKKLIGIFALTLAIGTSNTLAQEKQTEIKVFNKDGTYTILPAYVLKEKGSTVEYYKVNNYGMHTILSVTRRSKVTNKNINQYIPSNNKSSNDKSSNSELETKKENKGEFESTKNIHFN